ncbi:MAG: N-acetylmuramoyl-L-alanine amidase [Dolichospermum sp. DL01]|nr:MAG: N-acetylmuramoyl-L-alanine amidase [Dolichospermum sp. DL01]
MIPLVLPIAEWILDYPKPANNEFDGDTALTLILIDLAILVNQRLAGVIFLTRDADISVSLGSRASFANQKNVDIFISIHCNSYSNNSAEGIETWIFSGSNAGKNLAEPVQQSLISTFPTHRNRGVKEANFQVLRETEMPAILVECEFISNPTQLQFLSNNNNQKKIAQAIALGI